jgi:pimeloyl-ACP methyl ester carboxylesterase
MERAMPSFHNGAVEIAYLDEGEGDPIMLVHGFASTKNVNWVYPGWVSELTKNGRRVIALDFRGHGDSSKLYDPEQYSIEILAGDVIALMDHLKIARIDMMGYSMGGRTTAYLARYQPARLRSAILGGIGIGLIKGGGPGENVARARVRRPDPLRPPRARRLPARLAAVDDGSGGSRDHGAGADRGRNDR